MIPALAIRSLIGMLSLSVIACSSSGSPAAGGGDQGSGGDSSHAGGASSGLSHNGGAANASSASSQIDSGVSGGATSRMTETPIGGRSESGGGVALGGSTGQGGTKSGGTPRSGTSGSSATGVGGRGNSGGGAPAGRSGSAGAGGAMMGTSRPGTSASGAQGGGAGGAAAGRTSAGGAGGSTSSGTIPGGAGGSTSSGGSTEAVKSEGCGKTPTLKGGKDPITILSTRKYYLRVPDSYDNSHPYRLVITYAESGSSAQSVMERSYFRFAGYDPKNTVFVAPDAVGSSGQWSKTDVDFTDKILEQIEGDLCIDKTRIFASGFSFGGAMSIAIACTRADVFRGVAFFSGADLTGSCPATLTKPIAYYASQASQDSTGTPSPTSGRTIQALFAAVNGCTADPNAIVFPAAGKPHTCTNYKNCSAGHPTVYCVFDGAHGWEPKDPGESTSWDPPMAWEFITQF